MRKFVVILFGFAVLGALVAYGIAPSRPVYGSCATPQCDTDREVTFVLDHFTIQEWSTCPAEIAEVAGQLKRSRGAFLYMRYRFNSRIDHFASIGPLSITREADAVQQHSASTFLEFTDEPGVYHYIVPEVTPWRAGRSLYRRVTVGHVSAGQEPYIFAGRRQREKPGGDLPLVPLRGLT